MKTLPTIEIHQHDRTPAEGYETEEEAQARIDSYQRLCESCCNAEAVDGPWCQACIDEMRERAEAQTNRVIVCGGRHSNDKDTVFRTLDCYHQMKPFSAVLVGGANGADSLAGDWARERGVPCEVFTPDWGKHGRAAGLIRNKQMIDAGADGLIAFPGGKGTNNMIDLARHRGIPVAIWGLVAVSQEEYE